MKCRLVSLLVLLLPAADALAKQDYTYIQSSLAFPWFMFFVFFALIMIPFFMVIALAWGKSGKGDGELSEVVASGSSAAAGRNKGLYNRILLPLILIVVAIFSILLVLNAYEAMDLMEKYGTAAPTMLNARP